MFSMATEGHSVPQDDSSESELLKQIRRIADCPEEAEGIIKWILNTELRIVVMGKTGAGKSSLLNTFLGINVFVEGDSFDPVTANVKEYKYEKNGVRIVVWDCPGLQDGSGHEDQYLQELKTKTNGDIHLMLYCIDMRETRSDLHWGSAIDKITVTLGKDIWRHTALVLTFANIYEKSRIETDDPEEKRKLFDDRVNEWQEKLQQKLKSIDGIEESTIESIKVMPAGKYGHNPLCGQTDWLSDLWAEMLNKVKEGVQQTVITLNEDRFREVDEDLDVDYHRSIEQELHKQPIYLTPSVKEVIECRRFRDSEPKNSAGIGARIKKMTSSVASAFIGAATNIKEALARALIFMYRRRKSAESDSEYVVPDQKGT